MPAILHFADAHIDMANYGRHDPESRLPMRVIDFLKSLIKPLIANKTSPIADKMVQPLIGNL